LTKLGAALYRAGLGIGFGHRTSDFGLTYPTVLPGRRRVVGVARTDAQLKLARAQKHFRTLNDLVVAFTADAYRVELENDWPNSRDIIIWAEAAKAPRSLDWGPLIGDVAHNLRSALDNAVWALSDSGAKGPAPNPVPPRSRWRWVAFPVVLDSKNWDGRAGKDLWALDPAQVAIFKELQPFYTGQQAPNREPLAVLDELWNIDKHRHLHLVNATVELRDVLSVSPFPGAPNVEFEVVSKRAPGPLVGRAEVGRAQLIPGEVLAMTLPEVHMDPRIAVDVAFDQGPPAHGGLLLHSLGQMGETVDEIIAALTP
jgi:hypothetical protein